MSRCGGDQRGTFVPGRNAGEPSGWMGARAVRRLECDMCMTCGCNDAHKQMGTNITYEDLRAIAIANGQTVDETLSIIISTAQMDRAKHADEYAQHWATIAGEVKVSPDWDRHEWAGENVPVGGGNERWKSGEWAGEQTPQESTSPAGAAGPTGGGHSPGEQHWAPPKQ
jgi:hypothetical protein